jgi:hypothetical protein
MSYNTQNVNHSYSRCRKAESETVLDSIHFFTIGCVMFMYISNKMYARNSNQKVTFAFVYETCLYQLSITFSGIVY